MNRAGLLNFWYYQNQIFQLSDGKMLLRGSNGSGKSLTMQSLFPVLFDGDTRSYRLDSFGSRDRKMEDYLLGEKGVSERNEGIGYLFLEVKKDNVEEYLTIGIGMHANRGGKLSKWFFAIENNQRVGIDFELYEELRKEEITPLTKQKLKNRLESVGRLFENQKEYKHYVNERIFGFETIEQFDELIALLINLRSPKLSKDFNPSVIYNILRDSLPKLKEDELLNLSKVIEQLDGHHERLADLSVEITNLSKFSQSYKKWNEELVGQIAGKWLNFLSEMKNTDRSLNEKIKEQKKLQESYTQQTENKQILEQNIEVLFKSIDSLNSHKGIDLVRRGEEIRDDLKETTANLLKNQELHQRKQADLLVQKNNLEQKEEDVILLENNLNEILIDNEQYLDYVNLVELDASYTQKLRTNLKSSEYNYWKTQVKNRLNHLEEVIELIRQLEEEKNRSRQLDKEIGELKQRIDNFDKDIRQWQQTRQSEINKWKELFSQWQKLAPFNIEESTYFEILHRMDQLLETTYNEDYVLEPIKEFYLQLISDKEKEKQPYIQKIEELEKQKVENNEAIREWKNKKIPIILGTEERRLNRLPLLEKENVIVFYRSLEFKQSVSLEDQNNIEGALFSSGLLDSLISDEGLTLSADCQILPQPKYFIPTLSDYLDVSKETPNELKGIVKDILDSIMIDEIDPEQPAIFRDGSYRIANLTGNMPLDYQASYIGAASQERFRQKQIAQIEDENKQIEIQLLDSKEAIEMINQLQKNIRTYYETYPKGTEVRQAILEIDKVKLQKEYFEENYLKDKEKISQLNLHIKNQEVMLREKTKENRITLSVKDYEIAKTYTKYYEENIGEAYRTYEKLRNIKGTIINLSLVVERQMEEEFELLQSVTDLKVRKDKYQKLLNENYDQQKLLNVEEVKRKLQKSRESLEVTQKEIKVLTDSIHQIDKELALNKKAIVDEESILVTQQFVEQKWSQLFSKNLTALENEETLDTYARKIKRVADFSKLQFLEGKISEQYNFYVSDNLMNYNPKLLNLSRIDLTHEEEDQLGELISYNQYKFPDFSIGEESYDTFELLNHLKNQQLILKDLLKTEEEDLFKTFILDSVGNILRARINQGMKWVEDMNGLLKDQKNSSGLSLSIQWKPIAKSSDQELGTSKLVELLQKPVNILSEADKTAISQHFQEKVKYAQEQVKENEDGGSILFQAITNVLDYRDWFEFEMKYKRSNEGYPWQVLSDRRFNQFSGGEKAIAMYLPLFISVYSRYTDAESFCPKVITLDEAFAGIDDLNIGELFKACERLGFNYVMNSQALFGDYPTVSSLMIYELLRPQNTNLVTAVNYHWDGHKKSIILEGM